MNLETLSVITFGLAFMAFVGMIVVAYEVGKIKRIENQKDRTMKYVDLGLPSGTLWADMNEDGFFTFDNAVERFGSKLPTIEHWKELIRYCNWKWMENGMIVTGKNGNSIFLPAAGFLHNDMLSVANTNGFYWSASLHDVYIRNAYGVFFSSSRCSYIDFCYRELGQSVRLIK